MRLLNIDEQVLKDDEGIVHILTASVTALDWHLLTADFFLVRLMSSGVLKPKNPKLGADIVGVMEEVESEVKEFKVLGWFGTWMQTRLKALVSRQGPSTDQ